MPVHKKIIGAVKSVTKIFKAPKMPTPPPPPKNISPVGTARSIQVGGVRKKKRRRSSLANSGRSNRSLLNEGQKPLGLG